MRAHAARIDAIFAAPYNGGSNLVISESPAKVAVGAVAPSPLFRAARDFPGEIKFQFCFKESKHQ